MQSWFAIALVAPVLWSIVNHIDKYLLDKYARERGVGALMIFSTIFSVVILPFIVFYERSALFDIGTGPILILFFVGVASAIAFFSYLRALQIEEASVVTPLLQLIPVFGYLLSYIILGESLSKMELLASAIILIGISILSVEVESEYGWKIKGKVLAFAVASSFFFALQDTLFKFAATSPHGQFWVAAFWQNTGLVLVGIILLVFVPSYRSEFLKMVRQNGGSILSVNLLSETLYLIGTLANSFATLLAPVALVLVVASYQSLFVFLSGIILTLVVPQFVKEKISRAHIIQKVLSICIILIGSYLLYSARGL